MSYYLILLPIALVLITSKIFMKLCNRIHLPSVIGMLIAGIVVGLINYIPGQTILNETSTEGIGFFAQIGVVLIMFSAGLETDLRQIRKIGGPVVAITLAGVAFPLVLGFLVATLCNGGFGSLTRDTILQNVFYGTILTATSVSVSVATLRELGKLNSKVGNTIVAAAILDDVVGIVVLSVVLAMRKHGAAAVDNPWIVVLKMVLFFIVIALTSKYIAGFFQKLDRKYAGHRLIPIFSLSLCFIVSYISEHYFGIADITGAYIVGLILSTNPDCRYIGGKAEVLGYMIFVPLFFGNIGISTRFNSIDLNILFFGALFIAAGMLGKIIGCWSTATLCRYTPRDAFKVGIGMMARAEVALVTAQKGVDYGIIDTTIMPFVVILIILTSFATPIALQLAYRSDAKRLLRHTAKQS